MNEIEEIKSGKGPGSQLWNILELLGIEHKTDCPCIMLAHAMNSLGVAGCVENRSRLIQLMRKTQSTYSWKHYCRAAIRSVKTGWVFKINPFDPVSSLFDISVSLAKEHGYEY